MVHKIPFEKERGIYASEEKNYGDHPGSMLAFDPQAVVILVNQILNSK